MNNFSFTVEDTTYSIRMEEFTSPIGFRARLYGPHGLIMEPHDATKIGAIERLADELKATEDPFEAKIARAISAEIDRALSTSAKKTPIETVVIKRYGKPLEVVAKRYKGDLLPTTYANRTQAYKKVEALGPGWHVYQWGRPFLVGKS